MRWQPVGGGKTIYAECSMEGWLAVTVRLEANEAESVLARQAELEKALGFELEWWPARGGRRYVGCVRDANTVDVNAWSDLHHWMNERLGRIATTLALTDSGLRRVSGARGSRGQVRAGAQPRTKPIV